MVIVHTSGEYNQYNLEQRRDKQTDKRPLDGQDASLRRDNGWVYHPMRMAMSAVMVTLLVLMVVLMIGVRMIRQDRNSPLAASPSCCL
jgi:hypothetical protein